MTYNGWGNYETWLTNLWFENYDFTDQVDDGHFDDMDQDEILSYVADYIEESVGEYISEQLGVVEGFILDVVNSFVGDVDWREIAEHYVDDIVAAVAARSNGEEE